MGTPTTARAKKAIKDKQERMVTTMQFITEKSDKKHYLIS